MLIASIISRHALPVSTVHVILESGIIFDPLAVSSIEHLVSSEPSFRVQFRAGNWRLTYAVKVMLRRVSMKQAKLHDGTDG